MERFQHKRFLVQIEGEACRVLLEDHFRVDFGPKKELTKILEELGKDGWEVVSTTNVEKDRFYVFLKRHLTN